MLKMEKGRKRTIEDGSQTNEEVSTELLHQMPNVLGGYKCKTLKN